MPDSLLQLRNLAALAAIALALAACGDDAAPVEEGDGSVSGEVLPGTISDDMLPLDGLRSQAPRLASERDEQPSDESAEETAEPEPEPVVIEEEIAVSAPEPAPASAPAQAPVAVVPPPAAQPAE